MSLGQEKCRSEMEGAQEWRGQRQGQLRLPRREDSEGLPSDCAVSPESLACVL